MLDELQGMSKSLGSLKALQEVDFAQTSEHLKGMNSLGNFVFDRRDFYAQ